ncbi:MAG TPA: hypothetical protein VFH33_03510 [Candidatus Krumholzibacteria bacterium]|nr:hypothetical protein [Candidatus Krumholzibacteria bacterium]
MATKPKTKTKAKVKVRVKPRKRAVPDFDKLLDERLAERLAALGRAFPPTRAPMTFIAVAHGVPSEGAAILVRLSDGTYRDGCVIDGIFCAYNVAGEEFVPLEHPERITHWMEILDPVQRPTPKESADGPAPESEDGP